MRSNIEKWKVEIQSEDWNVALDAADNLGKIGGDNVIDFLLNLLSSNEMRIRNAAALAIRNLQDSKAIEPLLVSIFNPENKDYNGTMVYALQTLDCKNNLVDIFKILFYESYESKIVAYAILEEQTFEFSREELLKIKAMWGEIENNSNELYDKETMLMMKDAYEGFISYLETGKDNNLQIV